MALAERAGLQDLAAAHVRPAGGGVNADSIADMGILRHLRLGKARTATIRRGLRR